ncbi:MAG: hypothetical protein ACAI34_17695 [Verrucomicrobium sp.]
MSRLYFTLCGLVALGLATVGAAEEPKLYTLKFSGKIDGSDIIQIGPTHAEWVHQAWGMPEGPVTLAGREWNPQKSEILPFGGARLLPPDLQNYRVLMRTQQARDIAVAEIQGRHVLVHLNDTPQGAEPYEFELLVVRKAKPRRSPRAALSIMARIDGSERIRITTAKAEWIHKYWEVPEKVSMNGVEWDPRTALSLENQGVTRFLPPDVDISTARLVQFAGRDTATLQQGDGYVEIVLADNPNGADDYNLTLAFGSDGEPETSVEGLSVAEAGTATASRQTLAASSVGAVPQIEPLVEGEDLKLQWPADAEGWVLETSVDLQPESWKPITTGIEERDGKLHFHMRMNESQRFFRLRKPQ